jgi:hypothetical protein
LPFCLTAITDFSQIAFTVIGPAISLHDFPRPPPVEKSAR